MFTVKATYRNETRKLTFAGSFPSYDELTVQLYRVFPIGTFYLSKVIFSPQKDTRVLISSEVHSAEDYNKAIAPYASRVHADASLKFTLYEEASNRESRQMLPTSSAAPSGMSTPAPTDISSFSRHSTYSIPPPPILYNTVAPSTPSVSTLYAPIRRESQPVLAVPLPTAPTFTPVSSSTFDTPSQVLQTELDTIVDNLKKDVGRLLENASTNGSSIASHSDSGLTGNTSGSLATAEMPMETTTPVIPQANNSTYLGRLSSFGGQGTYPTNSQPAPAHYNPQSSTTIPAPSTAGPSAVTHYGIVCDACEQVPVGVRHKCLDCPDYDLCDKCISSGAAAAHNPFHEFFDIEEPGRVIVHTIFSGGKEEGSRTSTSTTENNQPSVPEPARPAAPETNIPPPLERHNASCNMCESNIRGVRHKCLICPDYDVCENCYSITSVQHPGHGFAHIKSKNDLSIRDMPTRGDKHYARCDSCLKRIYGVRYKCMHQDCKDFDLCANCEALPIPVHPVLHPMLKIKSPQTVIPTVLRTKTSPLARSPPAKEIIPTPAIVEPVVEAKSQFSHIQARHEEEAPKGVEKVDVNGEKPKTGPSDLPGPYLTMNPNDALFQGIWPRVATELRILAQDMSLPHVAPEAQLAAPISANSDEDVFLSPMSFGQVSLAQSGVASPIQPSDINAPSEAALRQLINNIAVPQAVVTAPGSPLNRVDAASPSPTEAEVPQVLGASFVSNTTVPDGQNFPPGAEFVKAWRIRNIGNRDWNDNTEVVFVAGERFGEQTRFTVGKALAGEEIDIWTGGLKAPDAYGRYMGYWRLYDPNEGLFGHPIWIDINVVDSTNFSDDDTIHSLSSSAIIMPQAAPIQVSTQAEPQGVSPRTAVTAPSTRYAASDAGSDVSSISLVSVPPSTDDEDAAEWEASRAHVQGTSAARQGPSGLEYVVLYDDSSDEE